MLSKSKMTKKYLISLILLFVCLLLGGYLYKVVKNRSDMANILAIAGVSGAKVYTLEPNSDLMWKIQLARTNPSSIIDQLEQTLDAKTVESGKPQGQFKKPVTPEAMVDFERGYAYAIRIIMLKKWKPGMTRDEIIRNYMVQTSHLQTPYDFKNHADEFLGFK